ncbi:MAG: sigma-70 family RNA polymerase sigma factor [Clostridiales bacterium]|nr:sigma-70 family RNA polymerase sigma factor [Clostridiales bacterium]
MTEKELEKIYNEAYRAVYWTAFSLLKNEDDAQDIVQDTFIALINSYDSIKDKDKILPWLKKVAANRSLNRLTRTKTDNVEDEFFDTVETVPEDFLPDSLVESAETRRIIMDIIEKSLSEDIRRTLILFYFDEMSTKEIAEILGVPDGTVRRRLNFARNKIKKEVEKYEEDNDTKLFMVVPFLTSLFTKEAEQVPFKTMPASLTTALSASTKALTEGAATKSAATAAAKGTGIMTSKFLIGGIAAVVLIGATTAGILILTNQKKETEPTKISDVRDEDASEEIGLNQSDSEEKESQSDTVASSSDDAPETKGTVDPNSNVLMKSPVVNGYPIDVPCTIGDLKSKGFEIDEVVDGEMVCMVYDQPDNYYALNCYLEEPAGDQANVSDDTRVAAIELFIIGTDLDFYGLELGMYEEDFKSVMGTPYAIAGRTVDHGRYYYYLGLGDVIYEFYCSELTEDPTKPELVSIRLGTQGHMYSKTRLADVT